MGDSLTIEHHNTVKYHNNTIHQVKQSIFNYYTIFILFVIKLTLRCLQSSIHFFTELTAMHNGIAHAMLP